MKIYHLEADHAESERFFHESLIDYMNTAGQAVPGSALSGEAKIGRGPHGKPYFLEPALQGVFFSRSHTKGHELLCFSDNEIGIDCENLKTRAGIGERYTDIARRCFTDDEQIYIISGQGDGTLRFFEIWTAKEAYMKYTGKGFSEGFRTFSVLSAPDVRIETGRLNGAPCVVYSVCTARKVM